MRKIVSLSWILAGVLMVGLAGLALAQTNGGGGGGGNQRGGWNGMNMQQMRQRMQDRMLSRIRDALKVTDAEWTVLKPKIQKIQALQIQSRVSGFMMGRRGQHRHHGQQEDQATNQGNQTANGPTNPVQLATQDLQKALNDPNVSVDQIKAKLDALRSARQAAATKLKAAQDDLRQLLTLRQEAVLVLQGLLN